MAKKKKTVEDRIDDLALVVKEGSNRLDKLALVVKEGFNRVSDRFDQINNRLDGMVTIDLFNEFVDMVDARFNRMDERFDILEFRFGGHDNRIDVLEDKVRVISNKIGLDKK